MPGVIFIEPEYSEANAANPNDDHPSTGIAKGQAFLAQVYADVTANPARWARTMLIVTYDEHGGFFDHVPPLPIPTVCGPHPFTTSGVRVPGFVVSPQVTPGRVFNRNLDHTSILQLLADKFTPGHGYSVATNARQGFLDRPGQYARADRCGAPDARDAGARGGGPPRRRDRGSGASAGGGLAARPRQRARLPPDLPQGPARSSRPDGRPQLGGAAGQDVHGRVTRKTRRPVARRQNRSGLT